MECKIDQNKASCPCTYAGCPRQGKCCECVAHHREAGELPGCYFSKAGEASYDRSIAAFIAEQ